MVKLSKIIRKT